MTATSRRAPRTVRREAVLGSRTPPPACDQRLQAACSHFDQAAEDRSTPEPVVNRLGDRRFPGVADAAAALERPMLVVVREIRREHFPQVPSPKISMRSVSSSGRSTRRSAMQFARGHRGGICTAIPASMSTASNDAASCPARSRMRNRNLATCSPSDRRSPHRCATPATSDSGRARGRRARRWCTGRWMSAAWQVSARHDGEDCEDLYTGVA